MRDSSAVGNKTTASVVAHGGIATMDRSLLTFNDRTGLRAEDGANVTLTDVELSHNGGGGLVVNSNATVTIDHSAGCTFPCNLIAENTEQGIRQTSGTVHVHRARIAENTAEGIQLTGGSLEVHRSEITENGAFTNVHGIEVNSGGDALIRNSVIDQQPGHGVRAFGGNADVVQTTLVGNGRSAVYYSGSATGTITNTIIRSNGAASRVEGQADVVADCLRAAAFAVHSSATYAETNRVIRNPEFADEIGRDYRLTAASTAVTDACTTGVRPDFDGNGQLGTAFDMGAFEYVP